MCWDWGFIMKTNNTESKCRFNVGGICHNATSDYRLQECCGGCEHRKVGKHDSDRRSWT